jgi:hypothetical protein
VFMGPVNRCSLLSTDSWLSLLLQWLCWDHSAGLGVVSGALFLGSSRVSNAVNGLRKGATYVDFRYEVYTGRWWTGMRSVCVVCTGFSPIGCTSIRITATLRYE